MGNILEFFSSFNVHLLLILSGIILYIILYFRLRSKLPWKTLEFEHEFFKWAFFPNADESWTIKEFEEQIVLDSFNTWNEYHGDLLKIDINANIVQSLTHMHEIWKENKEKT